MILSPLALGGVIVAFGTVGGALGYGLNRFTASLLEDHRRELLDGQRLEADSSSLLPRVSLRSEGANILRSGL